jgi:MFS family permease
MALPRAFWLLWFGQTFSRIGILNPAFLVLYLEQSKLTDTQTIPIVIGLFGTGVVVAGLVGGVFADTIGARRTIILAQPIAVVAALVFALAGNVYLICLLSLVAGLLSAVDRPAGAGLISKLVPQEQFARAYGLFLVGFNIGMSLGPVLAGFLLVLYPRALFISWAVCSLVYAVLVWALPADDMRSARRGAGTTTLRHVVQGVFEPFRSPVLLAFLVFTFLLACMYLQVNSTFPLDMRSEHLNPEAIGFVLAVNAVISVVLLPLVPRVVKGMRDETPLVIASVLIAVGFGINALAHGISLFVVSVVVWTLGEVLWAPMSTTFLVKRAPAGRISTYQGAYFFAWNAAFVVGGPLGITVANAFGYGVLWLCVLVLGIGVALGFRLMARIPGFDAADRVDEDLAAATLEAQPVLEGE